MDIKKLLIVILVVLLISAVALLGISYYLRNRDIVPPQTFSPPEQIPQMQVSKAERGRSLIDLVEALEKPTKCNFSSLDGVTATIYIANLRGLFVFGDSPDRPAQHVLVKSGNAYIWTDGDTNGYVLEAASLASNSPSLSALSLEKFYAIDPESLTCKDWKSIEAVFESPEGVNFQEYKL
jgi:hypothetical protein